MRKLIIDTDTASDDAIALVLALRWPDVEIKAVTTVAGNVPVEAATRNAMVSIAMADAYRPPVYRGCDRPLWRRQITAQQVHGRDGLGDRGYPDPGIPLEQEHAVDAIARLVRENEGIDIVTLGPLTNIAMAIRLYPATMSRVRSITAMGGPVPAAQPPLALQRVQYPGGSGGGADFARIGHPHHLCTAGRLLWRGGL